MSEFADLVVALNVPKSTLEIMGTLAWITGFVGFWVMAVLWALLPFNLESHKKGDRMMLLPVIVLLPGAFFTPRGRTIRAWTVMTTLMFLGAWVVGFTLAMALQKMPSAS